MPKMNIILVVFDSLRKDSVSTYGEPPWGKVQTPHFDALAVESLVMTRAHPESLPTLPARRALYTGRRVYPFVNGDDFYLLGDFRGALGWGPIPEDQPTLAEVLHENGYRTSLVSDVYHQFKPSKNYWRGFDQWTFLRGQETDPYRSGPEISPEVIDYWLPKELNAPPARTDFIRQCLKNMHGRKTEEDYFNARVMIEAGKWLEQNRDAEQFFLTVESFDPHEPWFVPEHYRKMYDPEDGPEQVISIYHECGGLPKQLLNRTQANYSGLVTMCDRWFGHLYETMRTLGLLENTLLIVTSDHGHSIGDNNFLGKRGYPSGKAVFDLPLMIRHPKGIGAGQRSDAFVQHTDISALILDSARVQPSKPIDGRSFWNAATDGGKPIRDHVTVVWGVTITVIDDAWWMNCKINGSGVFLYDIRKDPAMEHNVAEDFPEVVRRLYKVALDDAGGAIPEHVLKLCEDEADAPGCSSLAART